ncbi:MAG TPA: GNAT family N-acetyltransferase [Pseudohongiella sp.]|nr:GNAT family N-acetyltransferase [Pseudohongiella sp.]HBX38237.1 GNAT family N-acetyltransferase [Pseudohongiella sp.]|tara:strand:- start:1904 stop:2428 length:525 start_codon:yes stop_codon:yes gene_type:complete
MSATEPVIIRPETQADIEAIEEVIVAAFEDMPYSDHTEQIIVRQLRDAGALTVSLVAESDDDDVVGHVAVSPVEVSDGSSGWYGLGPISVWPCCQGQGIGSRLMDAALQALREQNAQGCVLLGEPEFYGRFGFVADSGLVLPDVPPEYFQALLLQGEIPGGTVAYHPAFRQVSP